MDPIHGRVAEYHTQTDLEVLHEQSVKSKWGGKRLNNFKREDAWKFKYISEYYPTLPQTLRGVKGWVSINPSFNDGKFTFSLFT